MTSVVSVPGEHLYPAESRPSRTPPSRQTIAQVAVDWRRDRASGIGLRAADQREVPGDVLRDVLRDGAVDDTGTVRSF